MYCFSNLKSLQEALDGLMEFTIKHDKKVIHYIHVKQGFDSCTYGNVGIIGATCYTRDRITGRKNQSFSEFELSVMRELK